MKKLFFSLMGSIFFLLAIVLFLNTGCSPEEVGDLTNTNTTSTNTVVEDAPTEVLLSNKEAVESGDLTAAKSSVTTALADNPNDPYLNFYNALFVWIDLVGDTEMNQFLSGLGMSQLPTSFDDLADKLSQGLEPGVDFFVSPSNGLDMSGFDTGEIQSIMDSEFITRIETALDSLAITKLATNFNLSLNAESILTNLALDTNAINRSTYVYDFDIADVYMYDAALAGIGGFLNLLTAWDMDTDIAKLENMMTNMENMEGATNFDWFYNPFADTAYNFGELTSDGATRFSQAKSWLIRAAQDAEDGAASLLAETDDQSDDVTPQPSAEDDFSITDVTEITTPLITSLQGTAIDFSQTNVSVTGYSNGMDITTTNFMEFRNVNFGAFFDNAPSFRDLLWEMDSSGEVILYDMSGSVASSLTNGEPYIIKLNDTTFGGLFEGGLEVYSEDLGTGQTNLITIPGVFTNEQGYLDTYPDTLQAVMGAAMMFMGGGEQSTN